MKDFDELFSWIIGGLIGLFIVVLFLKIFPPKRIDIKEDCNSMSGMLMRMYRSSSTCIKDGIIIKIYE